MISTTPAPVAVTVNVVKSAATAKPAVVFDTTDVSFDAAVTMRGAVPRDVTIENTRAIFTVVTSTDGLHAMVGASAGQQR